MAAPAVRIAVRELLFADEHAALFQELDDDRIRLPNGLALVLRQTFGEATVVVLRRVGLKAILLAGAEIVRAVAGAVWTMPVP